MTEDELFAAYRMRSEYIAAAETTRMLRGALRAAFPGVKFRVVLTRGNSANVTYDGGKAGAPPREAVAAIAGQFEGEGFDGMIDMSYPIYAWILDGQVVGHDSPGTQGSMGVFPPIVYTGPADARRVHFGVKYIFVDHRQEGDSRP